MSEYGEKPGVCEYCGFIVDPESEAVAHNDGWDFDHEECATEGNDE